MWYDMIMWYVDGDNNAKGQLGIRERFLWTDQIPASIKNPTSKCGTWTLHSFSPTLLGFLLINHLTVLKILIAHHERPGPILNKLLHLISLQVCWCKQLWSKVDLLPGSLSVGSLELQRGVPDACAQEGKQVLEVNFSSEISLLGRFTYVSMLASWFILVLWQCQLSSRTIT